MGLIEEISAMGNQGLTNDQIVSALEERGISPKQIEDAMSQAQIKRAVTGEENIMEPPQANQQTQEISDQNYNPQQQQEYYSQPAEGGYSSGGTETMIDVAEQVFTEKMQKIQKQLESQNEFKTIAELKLKDIDERLQRMEKMFDHLQMSILDKVGSYGKGLDNTKKEMDMMQDSFRKVVGGRTHKSKK